MYKELEKYIKENLIIEKKRSFFDRFVCEEEFEECENSIFERKGKVASRSLNIDKFIEENKNNDFQETLFRMIDERGINDNDVYNKVHIDRRLFSKIRNDVNYHPSKETVILLGLSLELKEEEIDTLLDSASYSLPKNSYFDLIIRFCFINGIYKIKDVNDLLEKYNCKLFNY